MKKNTLLAGILLVTVAVNAQDFYNFSQSTGTYTDLTNPTSMNNGQVWDFDDFGPFNSPFPVSVFGETFNDFGFGDDFFYFGDISPVFNGAQFIPGGNFFMDRDFSFLGPSQSPISYEVVGTIGNRILKLEMKNAGWEPEAFLSSISTLYMNFQVWLYEADNSIEFHYGTHNLTEPDNLVGFGYVNEEDQEFWTGFVSGDVTNPNYDEITDTINMPVELSLIPASNTIYRFAVNPLAVKDQEKIEFSLFPNPTNGVLNLTFPETVNKPYSVYDLMGREVLKGFLNNSTEAQINVGTLQKGSYILRIAGSTQKFIKN